MKRKYKRRVKRRKDGNRLGVEFGGKAVSRVRVLPALSWNTIFIQSPNIKK